MRIAAGFLFSETECERNCAVERRQFDHRPKLSESAQEDGLNLMVDGLPIELVQRSNRFWRVVQERYAKLFGMRVLRDVKQRKDTGKPQQFRKRNGKDTVTAVKRARTAALQKEASPHQRNVPASNVRNVFGVMPTTDEQLSELRKQEKTKTFEQLVERAKRK